MKNCRVTLDVVWLDPSFRVVDIAPELRPCPPDGPCPSSQPMEPARYVLELAGGTAGRLGIKRNVRLTVLIEPTRR
jgi:uncharacterized membrane protein (UPF0127 family)